MEKDKKLMPMLRQGFELKQGPLLNLTEFKTALPDFFYVTHMGISNLSKEDWKLTIDGLVHKPMVLKWDDLARFPRTTLTSVHECAGSPLRPTIPTRRAGNVEWEGIALSALLEEVGVAPEARFMWATGADWGEFNGQPSMSYQKDLPLRVVQQSKILLATHVNGEPLIPERGAPIRMVVPDFYGTNSVKWLIELSFHMRRSPNYFASGLYNDNVNGARQPVWAIAPHSVIVSPTEADVLRAGEQVVWGWAWSKGGVAEVEVSIDGGSTWLHADLDHRFDYAWQKFSIKVDVAPGTHHWICRAVANDGRGQPPSNARNEWFGVHVQVVE